MKIDYVEKLDKALMDKVFNGSLTVKEFSAIEEKIDNRFFYVLKKIMEIQGVNVKWVDYANEGGKDGSQGYFDPVWYREAIDFTGEFEGLYSKDKCYLESFPTRFLWEDFEEQVTKEYKDHKNQIEQKKIDDKKKRIERKEQKERLIKSAFSKLTPEECRALGHIKPKE